MKEILCPDCDVVLLIPAPEQLSWCFNCRGLFQMRDKEEFDPTTLPEVI